MTSLSSPYRWRRAPRRVIGAPGATPLKVAALAPPRRHRGDGGHVGAVPVVVVCGGGGPDEVHEAGDLPVVELLVAGIDARVHDADAIPIR
jgi:hypothetical protein